MPGLIVVLVAIGYLTIALVGTRLVVRRAEKRGVSKRRRILVGLGTAFVFWLIPFWDWIPTVVVHQYYCGKEAGFFVYKTMEQWKQENPDMVAKLDNRLAPKVSSDDGLIRIWMNQRFYVERDQGWVKSPEMIGRTEKK